MPSRERQRRRQAPAAFERRRMCRLLCSILRLPCPICGDPFNSARRKSRRAWEGSRLGCWGALEPELLDDMKFKRYVFVLQVSDG